MFQGESGFDERKGPLFSGGLTGEAAPSSVLDSGTF